MTWSPQEVADGVTGRRKKYVNLFKSQIHTSSQVDYLIGWPLAHLPSYDIKIE